MTQKQYKNMIKQYAETGYVPIGNIQQPYFIPAPTEQQKEQYTNQFKETWKHLKK